MDPLSAAASVTGILAAAAKISQVISRATKKFKDAPESVHSIKVEVDNFRIVLEQLQNLVLRDTSLNKSKSTRIPVEQVVVVLSGCVLTFSELEAFAESLESENTMGILDRVKWTAKASIAAELLHKVQCHKVSITTILTILISQSTLQIEDAISTLTSLAENVLESNVILAERLNMTDNRTLSSVVSSPLAVKADQASKKDISPISKYHMLQTSEQVTIARAFEEELNDSRVYNRATRNDDQLSLVTKSRHSMSWSALSSLDISDISKISVISLPIFKDDIFNIWHYGFEAYDTGGNAISPHFQRLDKSLPILPSAPIFNINGPVFGRQLEKSMDYAKSRVIIEKPNGSISHVYVPIVVAICGQAIRSKGIVIESMLDNRSSMYAEALRSRFDSTLYYDWSAEFPKATAYDYANVLLDYLQSLPEPVVPFSDYNNFQPAGIELKILRSRILNRTLSGQAPEVKAEFRYVIKTFSLCINGLPRRRRDLMLYLLGLFSVLIFREEENKANAEKLARSLQPAILSRPWHMMTQWDRSDAENIIIFMLENGHKIIEMY